MGDKQHVTKRKYKIYYYPQPASQEDDEEAATAEQLAIITT